MTFLVVVGVDWNMTILVVVDWNMLPIQSMIAVLALHGVDLRMKFLVPPQ